MSQPTTDSAREVAWHTLCMAAGWTQAAHLLPPSHELGRRIIAAALANAVPAQRPLVMAAIEVIDPNGQAYPINHDPRAVSRLLTTHQEKS